MILPGNEEKTLPTVEYDEMSGRLSIKGRCIAINVEKYFEDLLPYLTDCIIKKPMDFTVKVDLEYFSTKASKVIMDLFNILRKYLKDKGFNVKVYWYFEEGDFDMKESGEDYESLTHFDFHFIEKEE
jgi:hypothetical protein